MPALLSHMRGTAFSVDGYLHQAEDVLPTKNAGVATRFVRSASRRLAMAGHFPARLFLLVLFFGFFSETCLQGQVQLDRFFPPVVGVGQSIELKVEGKFPEWPITLKTDSENVSVTAAEKSGQVLVEVKEPATPGVVWVRGWDKKSAKNIRLSFIPISV